MTRDLYHQTPQKLEVDSEISSGEEMQPQDIIKDSDKMVTLSQIKHLSKCIKTINDFEKYFKKLTFALQAILNIADEQNDKHSRDGKIFNAIVQTCLIDVEPALNNFFQISPNAKPEIWLETLKTIKFKRNRTCFYQYLSNIIHLSNQLSSKDSLLAVLNHIKSLLPIFLYFSKLFKDFLNLIIKRWATDNDETLRILSFLIIANVIKIIEIINNDTNHDFNKVLVNNGQKKSKINSGNFSYLIFIKKMYKTYVANVKFTSQENLPMIHFMQKTFIEILNLNLNESYKFAFINIRQLGVQLRNAFNTKQNENIQIVYNWQFVHSLGLWCAFVSQHSMATKLLNSKSTTFSSYNKLIPTLVNPLVQITIGTIKLVPSARYIPLRLSMVNCLILFCQVGIYVPILPFITEILNLLDFNKSQRVTSNKVVNYDVLLKISKIQMREKVYKDEIINSIYDLSMDYLVNYSHYVTFPEITLIAINQFKLFLRSCKISIYRSSIKQLVNKIQENCAYIEKKRENLNLSLCNQLEKIDNFEEKLKLDETPFSKYYQKWKRLRTLELINDMTQRNEISEYDYIPLAVNAHSELYDTSDNSESDQSNVKNKKTNFKAKNVKRNKIRNDKRPFTYDDKLEEDNIFHLKQ